MTGPLILGAGPAGCAAAIALARAGAAPRLLDRSPTVGDALCGGFLSWRTADHLRSMAIDPAALGAHPVRQLALFAGRRSARFQLPGTGYGLSRRTLDTALRERALATGATLEFDTARAVTGTTVEGRVRRWHTGALFLATGKHDVRGMVRPRTARDPAMGLRLRLAPSAERHRLLRGAIELHLFKGGYAGIVLQEDGTANVCLAVRKSRLAGNPSGLLATLARDNPALAERLGDDWRGAPFDSVGAVPYTYRAPPAQTGVFRLGDQGAVIPSLAGEGMAIALSSGALAAEAWLADGPAASAAFQRDLAARSRRPVSTAALAWHIAETPRLAALGVAVAPAVPQVLRWLMDATRLEPTGSLARASSAS